MKEKKFERLPVEERKKEIKVAALHLFQEKGFSATTMENIVASTTLSKGGVYRIYSSTDAILGDLMIDGMHMRNAYYESFVENLSEKGEVLTLRSLVHMISSSLMLYPGISKVYVEFLWEKQRNERLSKLYDDIAKRSVEDTNALIQKYALSGMLPENGEMLLHLTDLMNSAILSMHTLKLFDYFSSNMEAIENAMVSIMESEIEK